MTFKVGQLYEMRCLDEDQVFWSRVRIYSDDGRIVWVRYAENPGNAFPVPRKDLRLTPQSKRAYVENTNKKGK